MRDSLEVQLLEIFRDLHEKFVILSFRDFFPHVFNLNFLTKDFNFLTCD